MHACHFCLPQSVTCKQQGHFERNLRRREILHSSRLIFYHKEDTVFQLMERARMQNGFMNINKISKTGIYKTSEKRSRWAMISSVDPGKQVQRVFCSAASVSASRFAEASSNSITGAWSDSARATHSSCRVPTKKVGTAAATQTL